MSRDPTNDDGTLAPVLHRLAIEAGNHILGAIVGGGLVLSSLAYQFSTLLALFSLSVGISMVMFGIWAWPERHIHRAGDRRVRFVLAVRVIASIVGSIAVVGLGFATVSTFLGQWIS